MNGMEKVKNANMKVLLLSQVKNVNMKVLLFT